MAAKRQRQWAQRPQPAAVHQLSAASEHPPCVIEGFVREDVAEEMERLPPGEPFEAGTKFLHRGVVPCIGAFVKMQVVCKPTWNEEFGEDIAWCLMGGRVHTIVAAGHVIAALEVTSLPAPVALEVGEWDVELVYDPDLTHSWVLHGMRLRRAN
jgi:hypothetical protein